MADSQQDKTASILVVDDAAENIEVLSSILKDQYRVLAATSGQRALDIVNSDNCPDLILLDVSMPDMDGYEVCRRLKANPDTAALPILFVTARNSAEDEVAGLDLGAADYLTKPVNPALVRARVAAQLALYDQSRHLQQLVNERTQELEKTNSALQEEIRQRGVALNRIRELRDFDPLTGLPNRDSFKRHLASAIEQEPDDQSTLAVVCIDIARFSQINSSYGHESGDAVLRFLAERLSDNLDKREIIGRLGSDSFVVLLRQSTPGSAPADLGSRATAVIANCRSNIPVSDDPITLDLFAGMAVWPGDGQSAEDLLRHAETALTHSAKDNAAMTFFSASMKDSARENMQLESQLRRAIEQDVLEPYYQPQINIASRKGCGAEALLRWPTGEGGFINPGQFIPLAENTGLIEDIGVLVQQKCFRQLHAWRDTLPADFVLSINLSAREFANDAIVDQLSRLAKENHCRTRQIELEVTEHALINDRGAAIEKLEALRAMGFRLSLDDFGTGYSSLAYVKDFPLDKLKIDRSFINDMLEGKRERAIVETIISLARNLDMTSVAEGVETEEQMQFLDQDACTIVQGFLYSPALPPASFEEWWLKQA